MIRIRCGRCHGHDVEWVASKRDQAHHCKCRTCGFEKRYPLKRQPNLPLETINGDDTSK